MDQAFENLFLYPSKQLVKRFFIKCYAISLTKPLNQNIPFRLGRTSGAWPELLIGTIHGLLLFDGETLTKLFAGSIYGISFYRGRWYAFQKLEHKYGSTGRLVSFKFTGSSVTQIRVEVSNLDPDIHQIDFIGNILFVTDTANNAIIKYKIKNHRLIHLKTVWPSGKLANGLKSENYVHLNSVFSHGKSKYIVFHNHTNKTQRNSEVAVLKDDETVEEIMPTRFACAHNYVLVGDEAYICDSWNRAVYYGEHKILQCNEFTRGIALTNSQVFIGGSHVVERIKRGHPSLTGKVYRLDANTNEIVDVLELPGIGNIYEIRVLSEPDFGLTNTLLPKPHK